MKRRFTYLLLSLRGFLKLIPAFILTALIVFVAATVVLKSVIKDESLARVGICGEIEGVYLNIATSFLEDTKSIEIVSFDSEEEALSELKQHKISGFVSVPVGFMEEALSGNNIPLSYTVLKSPASLAQTMTREVVTALSPVVYNSQNAVFGMRKYLRDIKQTAILEDETNKLTMEYIFNLIRRQNLFEKNVTGVSEGTDMREYYTGAMWVLFVLICGTVALPKVVRRDSSLTSLLYSRGMGIVSQVLCEWIAYSLSVCITSTAIGYVMLGSASKAFSTIPAALLITAMQFLIFELSSSVISGTILHFFTVIITAYLSGLFYPSLFFPEAIQRIGAVIPSGQAFTYAKQIMSDTLSTSSIIALTVTIVILITATAVKRYAGMRGHGI